ncbi:MAG: hypothetical protein ABI830_10550 [Pseudolabrys sp.]
MATLSMRALPMPYLSFARFATTVATVFDVFAEAQEMARAAHKRYPFIEG